MRNDPFWAYVAGGWRKARKPFVCMNSGGCKHQVEVGEEYYDTGDGAGLHYFAKVRLCRACADRTRRVSGHEPSETL